MSILKANSLFIVSSCSRSLHLSFGVSGIVLQPWKSLAPDPFRVQALAFSRSQGSTIPVTYLDKAPWEGKLLARTTASVTLVQNEGGQIEGSAVLSSSENDE